MGYSTDEDSTTAAVRLTSCALSFVGSLFIVASYVLFKDTRTYGRRLLTILSVIDAVMAVSYALPGSHSHTVCQIQATAISSSAAASILWSCCISYYMYAVLMSKPTDKLELYFHAITWGFSLLAGVVVATAVKAEFADTWCWVPAGHGSDKDDALRFALFYVPLWITWVYLITVYGIVHRKIQAILTHGSGADTKQAALLRKLVFIPLILVLLRLPGSIHRAYEFAKGRSHLLSNAQAAFDPAQGLFDAIMFGALNQRVRRRFWLLLCRCRLDRTGEQESLLDSLESDYSYTSNSRSKSKTLAVVSGGETEDGTGYASIHPALEEEPLSSSDSSYVTETSIIL